jgi:hypothetical protein
MRTCAGTLLDRFTIETIPQPGFATVTLNGLIIAPVSETLPSAPDVPST